MQCKSIARKKEEWYYMMCKIVVLYVENGLKNAKF